MSKLANKSFRFLLNPEALKDVQGLIGTVGIISSDPPCNDGNE